MADTSLYILLQAKNQTQSAFNSLKKSLTTTDKAILGVTAALGVFTYKLGKEAVQSAAAFEKQMANVQTLLGKDGKEAVDQLADSIRNMVEVLPVSKEELGSSAYQVMSAGFTDAAQAADILKESAELSITGLGSAEEATTLMTLALNNFEKEGLKAADASAIMFNTVKNGVTTIAELSQSFGKVAPLAAETGVSFEELQAATAALTKTNKDASLSQTQLAAYITALIKPSGEMEQALKSLGYESGKLLLEQNGLVGSMELLKQVTEDEGISLTKSLGRKEALLALTALLGSVNDDYTNSLEDSKNATQNMQEALDIQTETYDAQVKLLKNELGNILEEMGLRIMPAVQSSLENVTTSLKENQREVKFLTDFMASLAEGAVIMASGIAGVFAKTGVGIADFIGMIKEAAEEDFKKITGIAELEAKRMEIAFKGATAKIGSEAFDPMAEELKNNYDNFKDYMKKMSVYLSKISQEKLKETEVAAHRAKMITQDQLEYFTDLSSDIFGKMEDSLISFEKTTISEIESSNKKIATLRNEYKEDSLKIEQEIFDAKSNYRDQEYELEKSHYEDLADLKLSTEEKAAKIVLETQKEYAEKQAELDELSAAERELKGDKVRTSELQAIGRHIKEIEAMNQSLNDTLESQQVDANNKIADLNKQFEDEEIIRKRQNEDYLATIIDDAFKLDEKRRLEDEARAIEDKHDLVINSIKDQIAATKESVKEQIDSNKNVLSQQESLLKKKEETQRAIQEEIRDNKLKSTELKRQTYDLQAILNTAKDENLLNTAQLDEARKIANMNDLERLVYNAQKEKELINQAFSEKQNILQKEREAEIQSLQRSLKEKQDSIKTEISEEQNKLNLLESEYQKYYTDILHQDTEFSKQFKSNRLEEQKYVVEQIDKMADEYGDLFSKYGGGRDVALSKIKELKVEGRLSEANTLMGQFRKDYMFDNGGVVPGAIGSPQMILAHGGETVLPTHKQRSSNGIVINFNGPVYDKTGLRTEIERTLMPVLKSNIQFAR